MHNSIGIIESAPAGIGPPVIILIALPGLIEGNWFVPALETPVILSLVGGSIVSE